MASKRKRYARARGDLHAALDELSALIAGERGGRRKDRAPKRRRARLKGG